MVLGLTAFVLVVTAVVVGEAFLMARRKLPPNGWSGIRVERTLSDPDVWYRVHEKAAPGFVLSAILGLLAYFAALVALGPVDASGIWGGVLTAGILATSFRSLSTS